MKKEALNFSEALEALKQGRMLQRKGWNGKGQFVVMQPGYPDGIPVNKQTAEIYNLEEGDIFKVQPYLQIETVDKSHAMWVPSINDIFAEDWQIIIARGHSG